LGAVSLFAATFFSGRLLSPDDVSNWVRARAISERLKHEAYKFAARVSPYDKDEANAGAALNAARIQIEKDGVDLGSKKVTKAKPDKRMPRERFVSPDEYVTRRVQDQIGWFGEKVDGYKQTVFWLKLAEFVLALAAGVITTVASVIGKSVPLLGQTFDIAAFTAVLTTIAGIVLAHIEASRVDYLIASYLATKARLEDRTGVRSEPWKDFSDPDWPDFVNACEDILATENASWITKLSRNP
jgi:hypothetical protein